MNTHIGSKFYRFVEGETDFSKLEMLRLVRIKNTNTYVLEDSEGHKIKMSVDDLRNNYTKLAPDGVISMSEVTLENNIKDVVITLHRAKEIEDKDSTPFILCRQCIYDFFSNQIIVNNDNIRYVGMSISKETCPAELNLNECSICNSIIRSQLIDIYMDDKFDDFYRLLDTKSADIILEDNFKHAPPEIFGWEPNVKELLLSTRFMYDFLRAFNIYPLNFEIIINEKDHTLPRDQIMQMEDIIKKQILKLLVVRYAKDIDLSDINGNYILVSDILQNLYIIKYEDGGYLNRPYENMKDHRDRDAMINIIKNRYVKS